jgi:hypothetical protein
MQAFLTQDHATRKKESLASDGLFDRTITAPAINSTDVGNVAPEIAKIIYLLGWEKTVGKDEYSYRGVARAEVVSGF